VGLGLGGERGAGSGEACGEDLAGALVGLVDPGGVVGEGRAASAWPRRLTPDDYYRSTYLTDWEGKPRKVKGTAWAVGNMVAMLRSPALMGYQVRRDVIGVATPGRYPVVPSVPTAVEAPYRNAGMFGPPEVL
jgi:hypothetical protein